MMGQRFTYRNKKILAHARGQMCQNCGASDDTVVAAHSNQAKHGHGRGIKGEFVNLRESTALMSKMRGSSLIEYSIAFCALNNIKINEYESFSH